MPGTVIDGKIQTIGWNTLHGTKGRGNFRDILAARKYWWTRSGSCGTKAEKKPKYPPESDKNQKDIQSYFAATPRQATKKTWNQETEEPKCRNFWLNIAL